MMKTSCYNYQGEELKKKISLPKDVFGQKPNMVLLAQAVRVFLTNQRSAGAKTKRRGEVRGSGRKIWAQKGTGRARHSDRQAPIFVGGGKAHGPVGFKKRLHLPKKMKSVAIRSALSAKAEKDIIIISNLEKISPKTKQAAILLEKIDLMGKKLTICLEKKEENVKRAFGNLPNVKFILAAQLHSYAVLNAGKLIFTKKSLKKLENRLEK